MTDLAIHMSGVSKRFASLEVLKELTLQVPKQSIFAFLGNNGEGKSTAIRIMVGLLQPDRGEVTVLGRDIRKERQSILNSIGCLVDSPSLYPNLTAREFLRIACIIKQLPLRDIERALDLVGLQIDHRRLISQFSLGMKQRLALAHALLGQPKLLILDEPTNGLDPFGMQEMRQLICSLPDAAQCTVFVSSHQLDEVEKIATHVALLKSGKAQFQSSLREIQAQQNGKLNLHVDDAKKAFFALQTLPVSNLEMKIVSDTQLCVEQVSKEFIHHINAQIVHANICLYQSVFETASLEQWFHLQTQGSTR